MASYIEENNSSTIVSGNTVIIKPILFATYTAITKYNIDITYEDSTVKNVELVQNDKDRLYKFTYKKDGKLLSIIGVPSVYEINEGNKFTDFTNKIMDSSDLLFVVDGSSKYESIKAKFYLKDIRDIIDLSKESLPDPEDPMGIIPITQYPIYLNNHSCENIIKVLVGDDLLAKLTFEITKMGDPLSNEEYSDFTVLSVSDQNIIYESTETNKVDLHMTEETLDKEIKIIVKYFIKEINHPVFDEFTIICSKQEIIEDDSEETLRVATTQDAQYLGDGLQTGLNDSLTPGYQEYQYKNKK